jgi:hypothetical protein
MKKARKQQRFRAFFVWGAYPKMQLSIFMVMR